LGEHRYPEDLSFAELVDDVVVVEELDDASADDEEMRRRIGGFAKDLGSGREGSDLDVFREILQPTGLEVLEGRELDQEANNFLNLRRVV
jgi:hypothetical protein